MRTPARIHLGGLERAQRAQVAQVQRVTYQ